MSHFMEHMMFKGTPARSVPKHISEAVRPARRRAQRVHVQGVHLLLQPVRRREPAHGVRDPRRTWSSTPSLDDEACRVEREVVIEEIARMEDAPDDHIHEIFSRRPVARSSHRPADPGQTRDTVGGFDHAQSVAFRDRHYLTGNCRRRRVGQRRPRGARGARRALSSTCLPPARARVRPVAKAATLVAARGLNKETEQAHICYGVSTMNAHHPDRFALDDPRRSSRRGHVVPAVPGDPREARAGVRGLQLLGAVPGHGRVRRVRGHPSRERRGGHPSYPERGRAHRRARCYRRGTRPSAPGGQRTPRAGHGVDSQPDDPARARTR